MIGYATTACDAVPDSATDVVVTDMADNVVRDLFVNADLAWVATAQPARLRLSRDGGKTWVDRLDDPDASGFADVAIVTGDPPRIIAVTREGAVWRSVDGLDFTRDADTGCGAVLDVAWSSAGVGLTVGIDGELAVSADRGATWRRVPSGTDRTLTAAVWNDERVFAVGDRGTILVSSNQGQDWRPARCETDQPLLAVAFLDGSVGIAAGRGGAMVRTTDGGESWQRVETGLPESTILAADALGEDIAVAGIDGLLAVSRDGGRTWRRRQTDAETDWESLAIGPDGRIWLGSESTVRVCAVP